DQSDALARMRPAQLFQLRQKTESGAFDGPIVGGIVAAGEETLGFGRPMGGMEEIVLAQQERKMSALKRRMTRLRRLRRISCGKPALECGREFCRELIRAQEPMKIGKRGGIRNRGAAGESRFLSGRDVADGERDFRGCRSGNGEAAAFYRGKMLANG